MFSARIADSKVELITRESRSDATSFIQDRVVGEGTTRSLSFLKEYLGLFSMMLPCITSYGAGRACFVISLSSDTFYTYQITA